MAKQSGIHQLRGKVGEHSYYRQTGIVPGLVRSINQGMSSRVKTDEAFANTRLNNAEFGQAGRLASVLAQYITPKFRPMVLPFSQAKMAKLILEYIKNDSTAPWGQRNITQGNSGEVQVAALNSVVKNRLDDFGFGLVIDEEAGSLTVTPSAETVNKFAAIGADGFIVRFVASATWVGEYTRLLNEYAPSAAKANIYEETADEIEADASVTFFYTIPAPPSSGAPAFAAVRTGVLILLPYRTVNGNTHILQEHCTYKSFLIQDGAVN